MKSLQFCWMIAITLVSLGGSTICQAQSQEEPAWSQWRGPSRDGKLADDAPWPQDLSEKGLKQLWRVQLGPSYSGPIVADGKVFTTESVDEKFEVVRAFDRDTGRELWKRQWDGAMKVPFFAKANGDWIRSTPAYDSGRLYVGGMVDHLLCLDASDGSVVWQHDFPAELGTSKPDFGFVCSPLVHEGHVYVQAGGGFVKLDKETGEIAWRVMEDGGGMMGSAFSSPVIATVANKKQLLVQSRMYLAGVDIESGKMLWKQDVPNFRGMNILTPTTYEDAVFTSTYSRNSFLYRIEATSVDRLEPKMVWQNKVKGYMTSPVIIDGHAYFHLQNRCLACVDLESGERTWQSPRFGQYSSLIARGNQILALDQTGKLLIFNANPDRFELVAERQISEQETWAHLAISGDELFIRELNALTAFRFEE